MRIPKYIQDLLGRCEWPVERGMLPKGYDPGYTVFLHKRTSYSLAATLDREAKSLVSWCRRAKLSLSRGLTPEDAEGSATVHECPGKTRYRDQWAVITIYDPVMKHIEGFIPSRKP